MWHSNIRVLMFIQSKRHYAWVLASWAIIVGHCCSCDIRASYHSFKKCYFYLHLKTTICPCSAQNIGPLLTIHYSYEKSLEWVMVDKIKYIIKFSKTSIILRIFLKTDIKPKSILRKWKNYRIFVFIFIDLFRGYSWNRLQKWRSNWWHHR